MADPLALANFTFSQSSLQDFSDCPRRFELRYLEHLRWPAVESEPALENELRQQQGQLFHKLIQQHLLGIPQEFFADQLVNPDLKRWWQNFISYAPDLAGYTLHPEITLSAPLIPGHRLIAKYDLLALQPGKSALILDWKTSIHRPRNEAMAVRWQTRLYSTLLVLAGSHLNDGQPLQPASLSMTYWYPEHPLEPATFPYSAARFDLDKKAIIDLVTGIIARTDFPRTDDEKKCAYCIYRSYCARGAEASRNPDSANENFPPEPDLDFEQIQELLL